MNVLKLGLFFILSLMFGAMSAQTSKPIRGVILDSSSGEILSWASVSITNINPPRGVMSDSLGNFIFDKLPIGRYDIQATLVGYEPMEIKEVLVSSSKETFLTFSLKENVNQMEEIIVRPKINKQESINPMALASARMLSVEEANRYAGGFDDPARLVSSFAGVAGSVSSNSITIRGNSPQTLLWKLEGIEIPNPTHFPDVTGLGGGILSGLSSQVLGNSDFFTGAFPAEYGNALSGVFDLHMREGNRWERENTVQIGVTGIDVASEGPFKKGGKSSYIFNYRYSSMALLPESMVGRATGMKYQDLSFKMNFPTKRSGIFSVWGIGLIDDYTSEYESDIDKWEIQSDQQTIRLTREMVAGGLNHKFFLGNSGYIKSTLAATYKNDHNWYDWYNKELTPSRYFDFERSNTDLIFTTHMNKKYSSKHTNRTGINVTSLSYNLRADRSPDFGTDPLPMINYGDDDGNSMAYSAYSNSIIQLSNKFSVNVGITGQYFKLTDKWSIEPRAGLKMQLTNKHSIGLAYGKHAQRERLEYYFVKTPETGNELVNKDLDFAKAHHFVMSYDWTISKNLHLKIEPYYQHLYDIPMAADNSFSIINFNNLILRKALVNGGKGRNYGIDITLERYLADGYYYLFTGSLFESKYRDLEGTWRDTKYNRNYLFNLLGGKEWLLGKHKQNIFGLSARLTYQGGDRYTPIDEQASLNAKDEVLDESRAFEKQLNPAFIFDFTVSFKMNKRKLAHEFALKMVNATGYEEYNGYAYNFVKKEMQMERSAVIMPNISYNIEF